MSGLIEIYKSDKRYKDGRRLFGTYSYASWSKESLQDEIRHLQHALYKSSDGFEIVYKEVNNDHT